MAKEIFIVYTGFAEICFNTLEKAEKWKSEKGLDTIIFKRGENNPNKTPQKKTECSYRESVENMATLSFAYGNGRTPLNKRSMDSKY